jgi:hypothetical protein
MPELAEVFSSVLDGVIDAAAKSEARHLSAQVKALELLAGKEPGTEDLLKLLAAGWTPDMFIGAELTIDASLAMTTSRERKVTAGGGITWGPLKLEGGLANSFQQGTQTNVSVHCVLKRQSRSAGLGYALTSLSPGQITPNA